jgi:hypothetical protein
MKSPSSGNPARYTTAEDILFNALVSDKPEIMKVEKLPLSVQAHLAAVRSEGFHLVSVRWLTGQFVHMFCEPGTNMPSPEKVIAGYHQCFWANAATSYGEEQQ